MDYVVEGMASGDTLADPIHRHDQESAGAPHGLNKFALLLFLGIMADDREGKAFLRRMDSVVEGMASGETLADLKHRHDQESAGAPNGLNKIALLSC